MNEPIGTRRTPDAQPLRHEHPPQERVRTLAAGIRCDQEFVRGDRAIALDDFANPIPTHVETGCHHRSLTPNLQLTGTRRTLAQQHRLPHTQGRGIHRQPTGTARSNDQIADDPSAYADECPSVAVDDSPILRARDSHRPGERQRPRVGAATPLGGLRCGRVVGRHPHRLRHTDPAERIGHPGGQILETRTHGKPPDVRRIRQRAEAFGPVPQELDLHHRRINVGDADRDHQRPRHRERDSVRRGRDGSGHPRIHPHRHGSGGHLPPIHELDHRTHRMLSDRGIRPGPRSITGTPTAGRSPIGEQRDAGDLGSRESKDRQQTDHLAGQMESQIRRSRRSNQQRDLRCARGSSGRPRQGVRHQSGSVPARLPGSRPQRGGQGMQVQPDQSRAFDLTAHGEDRSAGPTRQRRRTRRQPDRIQQRDIIRPTQAHDAIHHRMLRLDDLHHGPGQRPGAGRSPRQPTFANQPAGRCCRGRIHPNALVDDQAAPLRKPRRQCIAQWPGSRRGTEAIDQKHVIRSEGGGSWHLRQRDDGQGIHRGKLQRSSQVRPQLRQEGRTAHTNEPDSRPVGRQGVDCQGNGRRSPTGREPV